MNSDTVNTEVEAIEDLIRPNIIENSSAVISFADEGQDMSKRIKYHLTSIMILLNLFLCFSVNAYAQVIQEEKPKGSGSASKTKSEDIKFYNKGRVWGLWAGNVMVKWRDQEYKVRDLDPVVREYLWDRSTQEQREQLRSLYTYTVSMGKDWGKDLSLRMDTYYGAASEWAKAKKQWRERQKVWAVPDEAINFLNDADLFLKIHKDELTKEKIEEIKKSKEEIKSLGLLIGAIEVKKKEIAVKGLSAGLIGIITDYCLGFTRPGFKATSELVGMIVGDAVAVLKEAKNKDTSAGEQIALLNEQIAKIKKVLNSRIEIYKSQWQQYLRMEESSAVAALRKAAEGVVNANKKMQEAWYADEAARHKYMAHYITCSVRIDAAESYGRGRRGTAPNPCPTCKKLLEESNRKRQNSDKLRDEYYRIHNDYGQFVTKFGATPHPELAKKEFTNIKAWEKYKKDYEKKHRPWTYKKEEISNHTKRKMEIPREIGPTSELLDANLRAHGDTPENRELLKKLNGLYEEQLNLEIEDLIEHAEFNATERFMAERQ